MNNNSEVLINQFKPISNQQIQKNAKRMRTNAKHAKNAKGFSSMEVWDVILQGSIRFWHCWNARNNIPDRFGL